MKVTLVQLRAELRRVASNGEQLLLTLGLPVLLLVFFSLVDVLPTGTKEPIDFLAPGILALATMSTAMVSLGIGTGFERGYHVLKRLGTTPLGRPRLVGAKIGSVIAVEIVQFAVLIPVAFALGWNPDGPNWVLAIIAVMVGTMAFAGVGLTLAGRLPAEINIPGAIRAVAHALPSGALADVLRDALSNAGTQPTRSWIVLCIWAAATPLLAARLFRWD